MEYTILRYANVYGPRQDALGEGGVVAIFTHGMICGSDLQIFGDGFNIRDYVYVKDVARANLLALEYPHNDAFNIGTARETSVNQLYDTLASLTNYSKPAQHIVPRLGDLKKSVLNNAKAQKLLKWEPAYDLKAGLLETVQYYRKAK
jgi:UDP-glucose 4-epimerase